MYNGKRVVVFSPAGRPRTLDLLIPYVMASRPLVDEYMFWLNTANEDHEKWIRQVADSDPDFFNIVELDHETAEPRDASRLYHFWKYVTDPDTIYIRLDDDVVFVAPGTIENLVKTRYELEAEDSPLLLAPLVINNACSTHLMQQAGIVMENDPKHAVCRPVKLLCLDWTGWRSPVFASYLHEMLMPKLVAKDLKALRVPDFRFPSEHRFSINCLCFNGADIDPEKIGIAEEADVCSIGGERRATLLCGDALVAHYAFGGHYRTLDREPILGWYADLQRIYEIPAVDLGEAERGFVTPIPFKK